MRGELLHVWEDSYREVWIPLSESDPISLDTELA